MAKDTNNEKYSSPRHVALKYAARGPVEYEPECDGDTCNCPWKNPAQSCKDWKATCH